VAEPVDIILLSYNRPDFLAEMVAALEQRTRWPFRLTIVDNASGAPTRQWLRENAARFHQIVWNPRNEHLAGLQRGIAATDGELFVVSDADLVVSEPTAAGCWLTRLVGLLERHPDFGLIGVRLDSISEARNARLEQAPLLDGELLETATGVWLNLMRRTALQVPYMSDGITCHALARAGYRVGIAADVYATHLGDSDPARHPDYLARKQEASGWRTTYPRYPELADSALPPTLEALALSAPVIAALQSVGVEPGEARELAAPDALLAVVEPRIGSADGAVAGDRVRAVVVVDRAGAADELIFESARRLAADWIVLLAGPAVPDLPGEWRLIEERPGPHPALLALAARASRPRWRRRLLYSTIEHRSNWLAVFAAGCFGDDGRLRVYLLQRATPAQARAAGPPPPAVAPSGSPAESSRLPASRYAPALHLRRARLGPLVTKFRRLIRAEWLLLRGRGR
jgi:hypothetical protein